MTYLSDTAFCLTHEGKHALHREAINHSSVQELLDKATATSNDAESGAILYRWACFAWSVENRAIELVENVLRNLKIGDYLFIRIGQDCDDTEYGGTFRNNPFCMTLQRDISFDYIAP